MRNAAKVLVLSFGLASVSACHRAQQNGAASQDMSIEDNVSSNGADSNAAIETLPADESDTATNGELKQGEDNPVVNDVTNHD